MCWSAEVSLISFIIGFVASIILIIRNKPMDRVWGLIFMFIIFMQLLEFLLWLDQPTKNSSDCNSSPYKGKLNRTVSLIATFFNLLQPLFSCLVVLFFIPKKDLTFSHTVLIIALSIYSIGFVIWLFDKKIYNKKLCTIPCQTDCNNHHLQWQWTDRNYVGEYIWILYYMLSLVVLSSLIKIKGGLYLTVFIALTFVLSLTVYPFKKAFGAWWCVMSVLGPIVKLILPSVNMNSPVF